MPKTHHCPACGTDLEPNLRYPWRFCGACLDTAHDAQERAVGFGNASFSGGLVWFYKDDPGMADSRSIQVYCLIRWLPAIVREGHFGGVVALPGPPHMEIDPGPETPVLCFDAPYLVEARARLKPFQRTS